MPCANTTFPSIGSSGSRHDRRFLETCDEVVVLKLDGWEQSVGVQAEIAIARSWASR